MIANYIQYYVSWEWKLTHARTHRRIANDANASLCTRIGETADKRIISRITLMKISFKAVYTGTGAPSSSWNSELNDF